MRKLSLLFAVIILTAFTTDSVEKNNMETAELNLKIQKDISEIEKIIDIKQIEVELLEAKAEKLVGNSDLSIEMLKQANLLKMNCLKYEAAIACMQRLVE